MAFKYSFLVTNLFGNNNFVGTGFYSAMVHTGLPQNDIRTNSISAWFLYCYVNHTGSPKDNGSNNTVSNWTVLSSQSHRVTSGLQTDRRTDRQKHTRTHARTHARTHTHTHTHYKNTCIVKGYVLQFGELASKRVTLFLLLLVMVW